MHLDAELDGVKVFAGDQVIFFQEVPGDFSIFFSGFSITGSKNIVLLIVFLTVVFFSAS